MDFVVTLGGDGTLLHAGSLFSQIPATSLPPPPILAFHLGTLGIFSHLHDISFLFNTAKS